MTIDVVTKEAPLSIAYDAALDILTVEGVQYSSGLFRHFGGLGPSPEDAVCRLRNRHGVIVVEVVRDKELAHRFDLLIRAGSGASSEEF